MNSECGMPTLLFVRGPAADLPAFVRLHLDEQLRCLRQSFRVVLHEGGGDFSELCDRHQPDLVLLESGVYSRGLQLTNTATHAAILRLGFLHADAYCASRATALIDFDRWGVNDVVTTSVAMAAYTPELAGRIFSWPNFVDPDLFRDYGLAKSTPVLMTGSHANHYPWRRAVARDLAQADLMSLRTPHSGWFSADRGMVIGRDYARALNAASLVPTCGTIAHELVRKHLEVPAAMACLVAEPTEALAAAGFLDGHNCVLTPSPSAVSRMAALLACPDELAAITRSGHELVISRHLMSHRTQIADWYRLKTLSASGSITQADPFAALTLALSPPRPLNVRPRDLLLRQEAESLYEQGDYAAAERRYLRASNFHFTIESFAGIARCRLAVGDASGAAEWAGRAAEHLIDILHGDPDPVLWALLIRAEWCAGAKSRARWLATRYPNLHHPELDRIRGWVGARRFRGFPSLTGGSHLDQREGAHRWLRYDEPSEERRNQRPQATVLPVPPLSDDEWLAEWEADRRRCRHMPHLALWHSRSLRPPLRQLKVRLRSRLTRWALAVSQDRRAQELADLIEAEQPASVVVVSPTRWSIPFLALGRALAASPSGPEVRWVHGTRPVVTELLVSANAGGLVRGSTGPWDGTLAGDSDVLLVLGGAAR